MLLHHRLMIVTGELSRLASPPNGMAHFNARELRGTWKEKAPLVHSASHRGQHVSGREGGQEGELKIYLLISSSVSSWESPTRCGWCLTDFP